MKYYENDGALFTSSAPIVNNNFVEISKEEYESKLSKIKIEQHIPLTGDEWGCSIDEATEQDYQDALAEMGVNFNE